MGMWEELGQTEEKFLLTRTLNMAKKYASLPTMAVSVLEFRLLDFGEVELYNAEFYRAGYHIAQFLSVLLSFALDFGSQKYQVNERGILTL